MSYHPPPEPDSWRDIAWSVAVLLGAVAVVGLILRGCGRLFL